MDLAVWLGALALSNTRQGGPRPVLEHQAQL